MGKLSYVHFPNHQCFCFLNGQWGTTAHDILPLKEGRKLDVLEKINYSAHETVTCQGQYNFRDIFTQIVLFAQRNQSE